jgi:N-acetylmuramoyl-L-alanine amidase
MSSNHTVVQGDSMASLAKKYGFIYQQLWEHADNAELKELRGNPNILLEGDSVFIPDIETKEVEIATEERHTYRRKGIPSKLTLQLFDQGEPRVGLLYTIQFDDGTSVEGETDSEGYVKASVQPERKWGIVEVQGRWGPEKYTVKLGQLDPITELTGVQQRLKNMGRKCEVTGELDEKTQKAIKRFQLEQELEVTGEPDDETRNKLKEICGA